MAGSVGGRMRPEMDVRVQDPCRRHSGASLIDLVFFGFKLLRQAVLQMVPLESPISVAGNARNESGESGPNGD